MGQGRGISAGLAAPILGLALCGAAPAPAPKDDIARLHTPSGYRLAARGQEGNTLTVEYIPPGEAAADWSRMVTVQVFHDIKALPPDQFAERTRGLWLGACPGTDAHKVTEAREDGHATAVWQFACPLNPRTGKPETAMVKFISSQDSFYSVQQAYREPVSVDLILAASTYLQDIRVCDGVLSDSACPKAARAVKTPVAPKAAKAKLRPRL